MKRKKNKRRAQMQKKKLKMRYNRKRRKRSDKLSKNHLLPLLKVNLVQKKRKRPRKRNLRKLNLLLQPKLKHKKRKRKKNLHQLSRKPVDCKNHPGQLVNFVHLRKAISTILETSEKSCRAAKLQKIQIRMLKHSLNQIPPRLINNLSHLNSNKS